MIHDTRYLYITRKRKKWKFAHFDSYENSFTYGFNDADNDTWSQISKYLPSDKKLIIEIAAGNAQFSLELARRYPDFNFIAIDIKSDRLYTSAKEALDTGVSNIAFVRMHLSKIDTLIPGGAIDCIWLTFPDPYPRKRSAKHRLSHPSYLSKYSAILSDSGSLKFKTDNRTLFLWSLEQMVSEQWHIAEISFDLHESMLSRDYMIKTYYENKFIGEGIPINFLSCRPA